jgi:hypothetical protein
MSNNPVVFWELASHDAEKSVKFFKNVFNWNLKYYDKVGIYEIAADDPHAQESPAAVPDHLHQGDEHRRDGAAYPAVRRPDHRAGA